MKSSDGRFAFKSLDSSTRVEVLRLAKRGMRHPDPIVARAGYEWSNHESWNSWPNRAPGWLLPTIALSMAILFAVLGLPVIMTGLAALAGVFGLVGWSSVSSARQVRQVYEDGTLPMADESA